MTHHKTARLALAGVPLLFAGIVALMTTSVHAADHTEPPAVSGNSSADIGDVYTWHESGNLVTVVTFGGPVAPKTGQQPAVSRDVLYGIHIDNNNDQKADIDVWARFGKDGSGTWGVRVDNLPGATGPVVGEVGKTLTAGGGSSKVYVGLREDPFFFDLQGFMDSVSNKSLLNGAGKPYFDKTRDLFAGKNITALVIEVPLSGVKGNNDVLDIWASTSAFKGGSP